MVRALPRHRARSRLRCRLRRGRGTKTNYFLEPMNIRRRSLTDSLQLLVDTICNLFGSIVIISLLMALLSKDVPPDAAANQSTDLQRQIQQTQSDLEESHRFQSTIQPNPEDAQRLALDDRIKEPKPIIPPTPALIKKTPTQKTTTPTAAQIPTENLLNQKSTLETQLAALTNQINHAQQANT